MPLPCHTTGTRPLRHSRGRLVRCGADDLVERGQKGIEGVAARTHSSRMANVPGEKADRWGIYVGLWALTFMALGNAIQTAEGSD